ncbi:hypothetical protein W824_09660 [Clavibacter cf. michiganensis LMG 26808]|nr:hypothetical protein W824_09660 [Clavibacter cf. michiganensis LMG 26808]
MCAIDSGKRFFKLILQLHVTSDVELITDLPDFGTPWRVFKFQPLSIFRRDAIEHALQLLVIQ